MPTSSGRPFEFSPPTQKEVWVRQGGCCALCGKDLERLARQQEELWNLHHAIPVQLYKIKGEGTGPRVYQPDGAENGVYLCYRHHVAAHEDGNFRTGAMTQPQWFRFSHGKARDSHLKWCMVVTDEWIRLSRLPNKPRPKK
jgi:hypothetical protein